MNLHLRAGAWRTGDGCQYMAGGQLTERFPMSPRREGMLRLLAVFYFRRIPSHARGNTGSIMRAGNGLFPAACSRRGVRQSGLLALWSSATGKLRLERWQPVGIPINFDPVSEARSFDSAFNGYKIAGPPCWLAFHATSYSTSQRLWYRPTMSKVMSRSDASAMASSSRRDLEFAPSKKTCVKGIPERHLARIV